MNITKTLAELKNVKQEKPNKILSMYLNTDPSDPEQQAGEWKIHLKNGLNNFENYLEESGDKEELKNFRQVKAKVEEFVHANEQDFRKGIVLFATADESVWFAERLQMSVATEFYWEETLILNQLEELQATFPKSGVILVQQSNVKIIEAELGEVLETKHYELDLDIDDWRQFAGPHEADASMGKGGKSVQKDNFNSRFRANQQRWYKSLAPTLDKLAKDHEWSRIYLVGEKEEARDIENYMNKEVNKVEGKNLLDHEETKVIEQIVAVA